LAAAELRRQCLRPIGIHFSQLLLAHLQGVGHLRRGAHDEPKSVLFPVVEDLPDVLGLHKYGREGVEGEQLVVDPDSTGASRRT
jgi:hypothetical protein